MSVFFNRQPNQATSAINASIRIALAVFTSLFFSQGAAAYKCLFISSYHQGYAWSDGVERGLRTTLGGKCELMQFDMDTKRNKEVSYKEKSALEAKALIESWKPDVVITADDNAAKYVIQAHYKDHSIPFVFNGVNWTVKEYGFPYSNVTGMVEVAPIKPMLDQAVDLLDKHDNAIYIGANTLTEKKNLARFQRLIKEMRLTLDSRLVDTADQWLDAYKNAQGYDFIIMGSNSGIKDWDEDRLTRIMLPITSKLSVTSHSWMMPYSILGYTKVAEEHGEWAGEAVLSILSGVSPADIAIVPNRKWDLWVNSSLLDISGVKLPDSLLKKAKKSL